MLFSYQDHTVNDFGFLHPPQVEGDTTEDVWDHRVVCGIVGGEHDGMGFGCASLRPYSHVSSHLLPSAQQLGLFPLTRIPVLPRRVLLSTSKEFLFRSAGIHSQKWQGLSSLVYSRWR